MNVKNSRIDIIDNSAVEQPIDVKYGTIPGVLVSSQMHLNNVEIHYTICIVFFP